MTIMSRCLKCANEFPLTAKKCPNCDVPATAKNRRYKVIVRYSGQKKTKVVDNLALAREIETKLKHDITRGTFHLNTKKTVPTLDEFWSKEYLPWIKTRKKSWEADKYFYGKHLYPALGKKQLDKIAQIDIERFLSNMRKGVSLREKHYSPQTIKHQLILLNRIFNIAIQWGKFSGPNPCKNVERPKINNQVTGFLSDDELNRLLAVLEQWPSKMSASFVMFALHTGLRRGELFRLTWDDINLNRHTVTIRDPKGGKDQVLPLSDKAIEVLKNTPTKFDTPYVFYGRNGKQRTNFHNSWGRIRKKAKLPDSFRFHDLRHHYASSLVSAGVNLYTVQALLCHKDSKMTQRYAHLSDTALRDAVKISDSLLKISDDEGKAAENE